MSLVAHLLVFLSHKKYSENFLLRYFVCGAWTFQLYIVHIFYFQNSANVIKENEVTSLQYGRPAGILFHSSSHLWKLTIGPQYSLLIPCYGLLNDLLRIGYISLECPFTPVLLIIVKFILLPT